MKLINKNKELWGFCEVCNVALPIKYLKIDCGCWKCKICYTQLGGVI